MRFFTTFADFFKHCLVTILFILPTSVMAFAQGDSATILNANAISNDPVVAPNWKVSILFDTPFTAADLTNIRLEQAGSGNHLKVIRTEFPRPGVVNLIIAQADLVAGDPYYFFATATIHTPSGKTEYLVTKISFPKSNKPPLLSKAPSDTKEDSDFYFSGDGTTAKGSKPVWSADIKIKPSFPKKVFKKGDLVSPFFELNGSTDPKADPDSMDFGAELKTPAYHDDNVDDSNPFRDIYWKNSAKIEANRHFTNANALWDMRWVALVQPIPLGGKNTLSFNPFIGNELGINLKSPLTEARHRGIERPLAGTTMKLIFPVGEAVLNKIVFEASYIRRWPLKKEISFDEDDKGNITALKFGTSPRDFVESKFNFKFTKFFGSYIGYEWGESPPSYKLVNSRVKFGFNYKFKVEHPE